MLIYAVADVHADAKRIERIRSAINRHHPEVLVVAGDIINYLHPDPVLEQINTMPVPVLVVRGNSDPAYVEKRFFNYANIVPLHANRITIKTTPFVGISGTVPVPFRTRIGFRQKGLFDKVGALIDSATVLVVHPPPWGVLDRVLGMLHAGSKMVCDLIKKTRPHVLICGHIHEAAGVFRAGETLVVNCSMPHAGNGALIELEAGKMPRVEML
jgi:Icc-related predicted phosphoesterase